MDAADANRMQAKLYALAADTGYPKATISWIAGAIGFASRNPVEAATHHIDAEALCAMLVSDINALHPGDLEGALRRSGIQTSSDIGRIVYGLIASDIVKPDEGDAEADFADVFNTDHIDAFLAHAGIARRHVDARSLKRRVAWALYGVGLAIVLLSYGGVVPRKIGWLGWIIGMVGFALFYLPEPKSQRFPVRQMPASGS